MKQILFYLSLYIITLHAQPTSPKGCAIFNSTTATCEYCSAGYGYNSTTQNCTICQPGYYSIGGREHCQSCSRFGYCANYAENNHFECPYYSYKEGSIRCELCPIGKQVNIDQTNCYSCSPN